MVIGFRTKKQQRNRDSFFSKSVITSAASSPAVSMVLLMGFTSCWSVATRPAAILPLITPTKCASRIILPGPAPGHQRRRPE